MEVRSSSVIRAPDDVVSIKSEVVLTEIDVPIPVIVEGCIDVNVVDCSALERDDDSFKVEGPVVGSFEDVAISKEVDELGVICSVEVEV